MSTKRKTPASGAEGKAAAAATVPVNQKNTARKRTADAKVAVSAAKPDAVKPVATKAKPASSAGKGERAVRSPATTPAATRSASKTGTAKPALARGEGAVRNATARAARRGSPVSEARFAVGDVVRHRIYPFRGVIFDIDPVFANTEEWWQSIPEKMRPRKNQPFYHLLAENAETEYIAYVSEQNLLPDTSGVPVRHPQVGEYFVEDEEGRYRPVFLAMLN